MHQHDHPTHKNFSNEDHADAYNLHKDKQKKVEAKIENNNKEGGRIYQRHPPAIDSKEGKEYYDKMENRKKEAIANHKIRNKHVKNSKAHLDKIHQNLGIEK